MSADGRRIRRLIPALLLAALLAGCAGHDAARLPEEPPMHTIAEFRDQNIADVDDPLEGFNRSMYRFNYYFDRYFFLPVVRGYEFITPAFVRERISSFFDNIGEVRNLSNSLFQLKFTESAATLGRFVTNSTIGLAGLFDPATGLGFEEHREDFGMTLGYWGAGPGPYLVLPILGPSGVRDAGGMAVDTGIRYGIYYTFDPFGNVEYGEAVTTGITTLEAVDKRHRDSFRYFESGYPFEYYMVRFLYHEKRELDVRR